MSKVYPARTRAASLPPTTSLRSKTVTWWPSACNRIAAASPPTPAPTTATRMQRPVSDTDRYAQLAGHSSSGDREHAEATDHGDHGVTEVLRETDRLHHSHVGILTDQRAVRISSLLGRRQHGFEQCHHAEAGYEPAAVVGDGDAQVGAVLHPAPVALADHLRIEEEIPRGQCRRTERDPAGGRRPVTQRRVGNVAGRDSECEPGEGHD